MMSFSIPFNCVLLYRGGGTYMDLGTVPHQFLTYVLNINSIPIGGALSRLCSQHRLVPTNVFDRPATLFYVNCLIFKQAQIE